MRFRVSPVPRPLLPRACRKLPEYLLIGPVVFLGSCESHSQKMPFKWSTKVVVVVVVLVILVVGTG